MEAGAGKKLGLVRSSRNKQSTTHLGVLRVRNASATESDQVAVAVEGAAI